MIAIAVDDEALMLGALVSAIEASPDITEVNKFSDCEQALEFIKENPADIAFLDINMRGMGGLALAEKIIAVRPDCKIVFCTGYEEYAVPAFKIHASGYLMKPISAEDVQGEIDNIKGVRQREKLLTVKCFGNFEVYAKNEILRLFCRGDHRSSETLFYNTVKVLSTNKRVIYIASTHWTTNGRPYNNF